MKIGARLQGLHKAALTPLAAILLFGGCNKINFAADIPSAAEFVSGSQMTINNGALYTNNTAVTLGIKAVGAAEMYVTNDPTCSSGGSWENFASERPWILAKTNQEVRVFAKFVAKSGTELPCIEASIIHDDIAPELTIVRSPSGFSRKSVESFELEGKDSLSGIDYFECRIGSDSYKKCSALVDLDIAGEGAKTFQARAVDRAGNRSIVHDRSWLKDITRPVLTLVEVPQSPSSRTYATIRMEAADEAGGSGIDSISCQWDSGPVKTNCSLSETNTNLTDGLHTFSAWALDKAGNDSLKATYSWIVNTTPSGDFDVIGVTGGTDVEIDNLLGTVLTPTVHWSTSSGAIKYQISILNQAGSVVCAQKELTATTYAYAPAECTLVDGRTYSAKVNAINNLNVTRQAALFAFTVDITPPTINITGPVVSDDQKSATFNFTITDPSGVRSATCSKSYKGATQSANCKNLTTYSYTNLTTGDHSFAITATDRAGNTGTSAPVNWKVQLVICDPFSNIEGGCKKGLRGNLYYLTEAQLQSPFKDVNSYLKYGKKADVIIYMSQLMTPNRDFTSGFSTSDKDVITDDNNQKLVEFFALDFETLVKLGPTDLPGHYQFGILSDDGSVIEIKDTPTSAYRVFVDNDLEHGTKLKCDMVGLNMDANTRVPMRIKYFQGPRTEIALMLVWRRLASASTSKADTACDKESVTDFFGSNRAQPDMVNYEYGKMTQRGWKALSPDNFVLPEEAP